MSHLLIQADARRIPLADGSVHCVVTSPPYWGLRDYGVDGQLGLEPTPDAYVARMVEVFREVRRVLRDDGTLWLNLGDSYASQPPGNTKPRAEHGVGWGAMNPYSERQWDERAKKRNTIVPGLKPKDLVGIPWRVALALQADGWYLRDAITWAKAEVDEDENLEGSAMPNRQTDRCTTASEMIFQLTTSPRYFFDLEGCKAKSGAPLRNVWRMNPEPTRIPHFATFPRELARRAILLGTSAAGVCRECGTPWIRETERGESHYRQLGWTGRHAKDFGVNDFMPGGGGQTRNRNGTVPSFRRAEKKHLGWIQSCRCDAGEPVPSVVLDPFEGSGTTIIVANALGRHAIGCDLSRDYLMLARSRIDRPHAPVTRPGKPEDFPLFSRASD